MRSRWLGGDSGDDLGTKQKTTPYHDRHRARFWVDLGVSLDPKIDILGYRFNAIFDDVFFVAAGAFCSRFWSPFGVQRETKRGNHEIWKSLF